MELRLHLIIDKNGSSIRGDDIFAQEFLVGLESTLTPNQALLSYFPADRAMPTGEVNIQLGANDTQAYLVSHLTNPGTKYGRLKHVIISQMLMGEDSAKLLSEDFTIIFEHLLVGKKLKGLSLNAFGGVSVLIEEVSSGKLFDIDRMSSGEKGLILQFLLMRRSVAHGGILMLDEPELHLNPAVCKKLLPFLIKYVIEPADLQALLCTHSAEILGSAFEREDCQLFHLRSGADLSPIYREDKKEVFEALRRLGASTSDVLFSKGAIFVEGVHDADLLDSGFNARLTGYKLMQLHGRDEVEKEIKMLQTAEKEAKLVEKQYFVFDRDRIPTALVSTGLVKIQQWDRYCFENYLLEPDAIYDAWYANKGSGDDISRGNLISIIKDIAMTQLKGVVLRGVYATMEPENAGLRRGEIQNLSDYGEMGETIYRRIEKIKNQVKDLNEVTWKADLMAKCEEKERGLRLLWEENWRTECDGKRALTSLHSSLRLKCSLLEFKKAIVSAMAKRPTENWRIIDSLLSGLLT